MENRYALYAAEAKRSDNRKVILLWSGDSFEKALGQLIGYMKANVSENVQLQLVEREDTGVLFMRISMHVDGRPFCMKPEEMGPDKYGF